MDERAAGRPGGGPRGGAIGSSGTGGGIRGVPAHAERREWLVTNGRGSYACGTVAGPPARSYHGLLIAARHPPLGRTLLVSQLVETVTVAGCPQRLDAERIEDFALEGTVPRWRYRIGAARLEKRIWMRPGADTTCVAYRLAGGSGPLRLTLEVCVQHRSHHGGGERPDFALEAVARGIRFSERISGDGFVVLGDRGRCRALEPPGWCGVDLTIEAERGLASRQEHLRAATVEAELTAQDPGLTLVASTDPAAVPDGEGALAERRAHERDLLERWRRTRPRGAAPAPAWIGKLVLAADAFVVERPPGGASLIAGYPWFGDWGRDTMISLAGLTLVTGRVERAERILRTWAGFLRDGLLPNLFPEDAAAGGPEPPGYNSADATLWFFQALREHHRASGRDGLIRDLFPRLEQVIDHHLRGTRFGIGVDPADGLLRAGQGQHALTWMDARPGPQPITPRHGKPVEVNALWINALRAMAGFAAALERDPAPGQARAARAACGFRRFWSGERGHCLDVLDGPA
ncbi:MAG: amylo-alpha-1,6-glucosidase, partial [Synechococcaceae cyanobacterium]|nr:amylo-alpha-1,6-glucosidase [Synechococcaceae cyanobacterium]